MGRRLVGFITLLLLAMILTPPAAARVTRVIDTRMFELYFAQDDNGPRIRVWSADRPGNGHFRVHYQRGTGPIRVLTDPRTDAYVGALDLDNPRGELLSYAALPLHRPHGLDVRLYDLGEHRRIVVPDGVNTNGDESHPTVSGDWLLFDRGNRVVLFNLDGTDTRVLASIPFAAGFVFAGQVNGDWAVYTVCVNGCTVHRYRISTLADVEAPTGGGVPFAPSVTSTGIVYYAIGPSSPVSCKGPGDQLHRWTGAGSAPIVESFHNQIRIDTPWPVEKPGGGVTIYFTRLLCEERFDDRFAVGIYATGDTG